MTMVIVGTSALVTSAQNSPTLNVVSSCNPYTGSSTRPTVNMAMIRGNISISGGYSGPITFNGTAEITLYGISGQNYTQDSTLNKHNVLVEFNPYTVQYPGQSNATFTIAFYYPTTWQATTCTGQVTINAVDPNNGQILATGSSYSTGYSSTGSLGGDYVTRYVVTLPTIPDSFFGITNDFGGLPTQNGYGFPIVTGGQIFQQLFYAGIIGLVIAIMISAALSVFGMGDSKSPLPFTVLQGSIFGLFALVVMLPLYDIFAVTFNSLSYWIMNPANPTFTGAFATTSDLMLRGFSVINLSGILTQGIWSFITGSFGAGLNTIAMFTLWLMIQLIVPLVGVARIFLIVAFVALGPIIIMLNIIPITKHLAELLISAIVGLMVAGPISATFIVLADKIITPGAEPYGYLLVPGNGVFTFIIVAAGILGAAFIPMVLAPITGFFFQTLSQVGMGTAMTAMTVGTAGAGGLATGGVTGLSSGLKSASAMGQTGLSKLGTGLSGAVKGMATVTPDVAKNMGLTMLGGVAGLAGASQAAKHIGYLGGGHSSFGDIATKAGGAVTAGGIATQMNGVHQSLTSAMVTPMPSGNLSNLPVNASGKPFDKPRIDPDDPDADPEKVGGAAKSIYEKWTGMSRDQAWDHLTSHNVIPKGANRNDPYTSKPVDNFINTMRQHVASKNPNNKEDQKQIMRLKNHLDKIQHYDGKVPA